jgi:hypothetical protein
MQQAGLAVRWPCNRVIILLGALVPSPVEVKYNENDGKIQSRLVLRRY